LGKIYDIKKRGGFPMGYRVIEWATGTIGKRALAASLAHPDLEVVGVALTPLPPAIAPAAVRRHGYGAASGTGRRAPTVAAMSGEDTRFLIGTCSAEGVDDQH
jgi:hypothetical protein